MIAAIRRTTGGETLFDEAQLNRAREWRINVKVRWESLSAREREVLQLLGEGMENKAIAKKNKSHIQNCRKASDEHLPQTGGKEQG